MYMDLDQVLNMTDLETSHGPVRTLSDSEQASSGFLLYLVAETSSPFLSV